MSERLQDRNLNPEKRMIWFEKDYNGWYIWFGKVHGEDAHPDYVGRGIAGKCRGYSLNLYLWIQLLGYILYRSRVIWYAFGFFLLGYIIGRQW